MDQLTLMHEDLYDALRDVVRALGGTKVVGPQIWPTKPPLEASRLLSDCLNRERREKLDPEQLLWLLRRGRQEGCHAAMDYFSDEAGYERARPRNVAEERRQLEEQVVAAAKLLDRVSRRLRDIEAGA